MIGKIGKNEVKNLMLVLFTGTPLILLANIYSLQPYPIIEWWKIIAVTIVWSIGILFAVLKEPTTHSKVVKNI